MDQTALVQKLVEERARCKTDRLFLACEVLGYDFTYETHQELFACYPEFFDVGKIAWASQFPKRDVLILHPRGHYKTTALVVICIQAILVNPDVRIILMQGTLKTTRNLLKEILSHFTGEASRSRFQELFPEFCGVKDEDGEWKFTKKILQANKEQFTTPARVRKQLAQATCTVASPKAVKTGQHYDLGLFDDLVNDQNYRSPVLLKKVQEDFDMCFPLVDPGCPRFVSGTRYAFGDLYENIMRRDKGEWTISVKTCWNADGSVRFPLHKTPDGRTVGFTKEMLLQIMRDNPAVFASQYLNQPVLESMRLISEQEMTNATIIPAIAPPLSQACLFIDLAAEGRDRPDDAVVIVGKMDSHGVMYVVDGSGGQWSIDQLAANVMALSLKHRPMKVLIEETASAKYFVQFLRMICRDKNIVLPLDYIKVNNQKGAKEIRIKAMAGHVKNGRLKFFVGLSFWDKALKQSTEFTGSKHQHDDYPDCFALMCNSFSGTYLAVQRTTITVTRHPVVALLERDPVTQTIDNMGQEYDSQGGTMGDEFV